MRRYVVNGTRHATPYARLINDMLKCARMPPPSSCVGTMIVSAFMHGETEVLITRLRHALPSTNMLIMLRALSPALSLVSDDRQEHAAMRVTCHDMKDAMHVIAADT